jgi:hypothetical protein
MKCTQCGQEIHNEQANGDKGPSLGLGTEDLFGHRTPRDGSSVQLVEPDGGGKGTGSPSTAGEMGVSISRQPAKGNGTNRRSRLGADWQPTQAQRAYCERQGKDPDSFLQAFKGYYEAKGTQWLNWGKVWEKACRDWKGHVSVNKEPVILMTLRDKELAQWKFRLSASFWSPWWGPRVGEPGCMVPKELIDV